MMDNPLNSSIRLHPPSRLIFLILPPSLLQICPPTREYPRVFTGATDTGVPCHFPEALKHIEAKCHGQVSTKGPDNAAMLHPFICNRCHIFSSRSCAR